MRQEAEREGRRVEERGGRWEGWEAFRWGLGERGAWRACRDHREVLNIGIRICEREEERRTYVGGLGETGREELQACRGMAEECLKITVLVLFSASSRCFFLALIRIVSETEDRVARQGNQGDVK